ncbi:MAG: DUF2269 family protein [Acidimicrobiia bacterium]|nr:DUF2269 family protein [Acidimicrobiia bacterium]
MGIESVLYRIILLLHIATAIVGFGGVITHGAYNARAFRSAAAPGAVLLEATKGVNKIADYALYALLPLGIVLIAISDDAFGFGDAWVSASFVVWFLIIGAIHGAIRPAVRTLSERASALAPDGQLDADPDAAAASRKLMIGEGATELLLVIALVLMIWQPGG